MTWTTGGLWLEQLLAKSPVQLVVLEELEPSFADSCEPRGSSRSRHGNGSRLRGCDHKTPAVAYSADLVPHGQNPVFVFVFDAALASDASNAAAEIGMRVVEDVNGPSLASDLGRRAQIDADRALKWAKSAFCSVLTTGEAAVFSLDFGSCRQRHENELRGQRQRSCLAASARRWKGLKHAIKELLAEVKC